MKRAFIVALLVASASTATATAQTPFDRKKFEIPHKKFVLDNGLTLLVHEDHSVPIVAVNLWYHVGSRNEKRGKTGFAHLFEHFFFNGSENHPHGFREAMDDLGATNRNGTTSADRTNFFEDVPVSALERTLYLEADRMGFLAAQINKEMLERERGVVQNEKRQGENQPYGRVQYRIAELMFPYSHPYSWSTIGSMEDLNAATLEDVQEWYRTYYGPNNCVLSLAGDITPERALELVTKYFSGIPPGPPLARTEQWVPKLERNIRDEMQDRVPQSRIYRVYHAPRWGDPDLDHLVLWSDVLSGSKSARLDRRLVYEKELATAVTTFVNDRELASGIFVIATLKPGADPAAAEKEMDAVMAELLKNGPTAEELKRAQSRTLADFVRGVERLGGFGGRADVLNESMTYGGSPGAYLDRLERMARATPAQVAAAGRKWLDTNHLTLVVRPFPAVKPGQQLVDRKQLPALGEPPAGSFPEVQRATLANGLKVMLLERHSAPLIGVTLLVDAGFASDPKGKAGAASLALNLMDEGTKTRDAFRIVDELDAVGAQLSTGGNLDQSWISVEALSTNLRPTLDVFADVILNPAFPADLVALEKKRRIAQIGQEKAQPNAMALRIVPRLLFGQGHPYANPFSGSGYVNTVEPLTREDLASWHSTWFHPGNSTLIVTGDVTMKQLMPEIERALGSWKGGQAPAKQLTTVARTVGKRVYLIDKPDAPQSVILATHVSEPGGQPEDLAMETVNRNFGGMATSRLNRNLRLDKHWSYGTTSLLPDTRGQRPFVVIAPVQTDKTKEAMLEVAKEIRGVAGERPLAGEEFASIRRNQIMSLPGRYETLRALENAARRMVNLGYPAEYFGQYGENVRALSEASLASAAKKYVRPGELIWIVVGDLKKIEAGVRELGFGEVERIEIE
ncbi:MAG TPA: pitrilysin family protein [Thermoanaerobaculia bacterium]|nr:pitrilysin family protein [Thermoanaerobaculia bacterium]